MFRARHALAAVLAVVVAGSVACSSTPPAPAPDAAGADSSFMVTLERTGCGFRCPVYSVTVSADGVVHYRGRTNVAVAGERVGRVEVDAVRRLRELAGAELWELDDAYQPGRSGCRRWRTDAETTTLTLVLDGRRKTIRAYGGCEALPQAVPRFAALVDETAGTARWVGQGSRL